VDKHHVGKVLVTKMKDTMKLINRLDMITAKTSHSYKHQVRKSAEEGKEGKEGSDKKKKVFKGSNEEIKEEPAEEENNN